MSIDTGETTDTDPTPEVMVLEVTDEAMVQVLAVRAEEEDGDQLGLRVEITGSQGVDYTYDLSFDLIADAEDDDLVYETGGATIIVPANTIENLRGATLDLPSNPMQGGLVIRNPNRPDPLEGKTFDLQGTTSEKVEQLLRDQINPSLAAHGGWAELVGVEGSAAYLTMGGGCQGCAMSAATLREGITVMITQVIPEITEVIDTTDHEAGDNPFFT